MPVWIPPGRECQRPPATRTSRRAGVVGRHAAADVAADGAGRDSGKVHGSWHPSLGRSLRQFQDIEITV
jgi:hypothetical protein